MADLKAVLFDLDGTLFDRDQAQRKMLALILRAFPDLFAGTDAETAISAFFESDRVTLEELGAGNPVEEFRVRRSKVFLGLLGLNENRADEIVATYLKMYPTIDAPVEGARSVVQSLTGRFQLGVVSNGFPDAQYHKLEALGVRHLFDCVVLSGELDIWKPDPGIFWEATSLLGREPGECLYVGDSYDHDVLGAKRAGVRVCWLNPRGSRPLQMSVEPDFEVCALDEILGILNRV